jgi:hypothetical protein
MRGVARSARELEFDGAPLLTDRHHRPLEVVVVREVKTAIRMRWRTTFHSTPTGDDGQV